MDEMEVNGNDGALNFDAGGDDPFAIPPPLDGSLLFDDPGNIGEQNEALNPEDNVDGDQTQDSAEKKKKKRAFKPRVNLNEERYVYLLFGSNIKHLLFLHFNYCRINYFRPEGVSIRGLHWSSIITAGNRSTPKKTCGVTYKDSCKK